MRDDCVQVDELLRQLADYNNDVADMVAVKLLRKCSTSWEAYRYLQDRLHDLGYLIAPTNKRIRLSKGYRYTYTNDASKARRMNHFKLLQPGIAPILLLLSPSEKTDHAKRRAYSCEKYEEDGKK